MRELSFKGRLDHVVLGTMSFRPRIPEFFLGKPILGEGDVPGTGIVLMFTIQMRNVIHNNCSEK